MQPAVLGLELGGHCYRCYRCYHCRCLPGLRFLARLHEHEYPGVAAAAEEEHRIVGHYGEQIMVVVRLEPRSDACRLEGPQQTPKTDLVPYSQVCADRIGSRGHCVEKEQNRGSTIHDGRHLEMMAMDQLLQCNGDTLLRSKGDSQVMWLQPVYLCTSLLHLGHFFEVSLITFSDAFSSLAFCLLRRSYCSQVSPLCHGTLWVMQWRCRQTWHLNFGQTSL